MDIGLFTEDDSVSAADMLPCSSTCWSMVILAEGDTLMANATSYVYAGSAHVTSNSGSHMGGLFRRAVGDDHWQALTNGLPEAAEVRAIAVHPQNPQVVYAGTQHGPYRSTDGGDHWEKLGFPDLGMVVWSILFDPKNPQTMYLGTAPAAVYRSDNGGDTWRRLPNAQTA